MSFRKRKLFCMTYRGISCKHSKCTFMIPSKRRQWLYAYSWGIIFFYVQIHFKLYFNYIFLKLSCLFGEINRMLPEFNLC